MYLDDIVDKVSPHVTEVVESLFGNLEIMSRSQKHLKSLFQLIYISPSASLKQPMIFTERCTFEVGSMQNVEAATMTWGPKI